MGWIGRKRRRENRQRENDNSIPGVEYENQRGQNPLIKKKITLFIHRNLQLNKKKTSIKF